MTAFLSKPAAIDRRRKPNRTNGGRSPAADESSITRNANRNLLQRDHQISRPLIAPFRDRVEQQAADQRIHCSARPTATERMNRPCFPLQQRNGPDELGP